MWLCVVLATLTVGCEGKPAAPPPGPDALMQSMVRPLDATGEVVIGVHRLEVELPQNPQQSAQGLMYRDHMPENHGMLFYYDRPEFLAFWMHNTRLPLSIAFIDASGRIDKILDMEPLNSERRYFPEHKCVAALETHRGWFAARGITAGATVEFRLPASFRKMALAPG